MTKDGLITINEKIELEIRCSKYVKIIETDSLEKDDKSLEFSLKTGNQTFEINKYKTLITDCNISSYELV